MSQILETITSLQNKVKAIADELAQLKDKVIAQETGEVPPSPISRPKFKVYVDAGHGGNHPETGAYMTFPTDGKRYTFLDDNGNQKLDMREGVINRLIADKFCLLLDRAGIDYMKLHHPYLDRHLSERARLANEDYQRQKALGNKAVLLSFHSNAFGNQAQGKGENPRGWSVWTTRGNTFSDKIAEVWFDKTQAIVGNGITYRKDLSDGDKDWEADFFIIYATEMPAVLVENLFFTNYEDSLLLTNPEYQLKSAQAAFETVKWVMNA